MISTTLRANLDVLAWTQRGFARMIGYDEKTVRQWLRGHGSPPPEVVDWLQVRADHARATPVPGRKG